MISPLCTFRLRSATVLVPNAFTNLQKRSRSMSSNFRSSAALLSAPAIFLLGVVAAASAQAFTSGSTGADGAFNPTVNTEVALPPSGILNYTTINIPAGVTVKFTKNVANTPIYLLATGAVTVAGTIDIRGGDGTSTGTYGDGALGDDGIPGTGGPGGYSGGRGGRDDIQQRVEVIRGGSGLGPGGGLGGTEGGNGCNSTGYVHYIGIGGGYATAAYQAYSLGYCAAPTITVFSKPYGSPLLQPLLGGSGGGGGVGGVSFPGSGGGGGGGAVLIASSGTVQITGTINARGGDSGGVAGTNAGGYGAGGSGGGIRIVGTTVAGNGALYADGGCINLSNLARQYCGTNGQSNTYGGAPGRIRIEGEAITYSGPSSPAYIGDTPGPVFIADAPSLRISSVAGQTVPANPTGNADVTLPSTTTGSIPVVISTTNVPTGNTVLLRIVPAYGQSTETLSPAISGTTQSGTVSVSVTLPSGPSTLQATTTYTVVVAGMLDLSRFAQNEPVEKVEVTVALVGGATARLLTKSGKAYDVSYQALLAAGFAG